MKKSPIELRNAKLEPKVVKALQSRAFDAWYFDEAAAAEKGYTVIDRDAASDKAERLELMRKSLLCDTYLTGANALSEDGQLVNIRQRQQSGRHDFRPQAGNSSSGNK